MSHHARCIGAGCPACEREAERLAELARAFESHADEEYETRRAEDRYERLTLGRD